MCDINGTRDRFDEEKERRISELKRIGNARILLWLEQDPSEDKTGALRKWRDDVLPRIVGSQPRKIKVPDLLVRASALVTTKEVCLLENGDLQTLTGTFLVTG
ncbi:hypothetical protein COU76_04150 [Candidatus Peregrinibacteria bacterium CG10_big_fil_rev_8_21_14_0_10_49_10]|nr:MAG: hypothetical protein COU76_04150 [Candidatus Peregrinibacteria bacterium CG10_big_fil_rev_8_21_14_0_10_49_10]